MPHPESAQEVTYENGAIWLHSQETPPRVAGVYSIVEVVNKFCTLRVSWATKRSCEGRAVVNPDDITWLQSRQKISENAPNHWRKNPIRYVSPSSNTTVD